MAPARSGIAATASRPRSASATRSSARATAGSSTGAGRVPRTFAGELADLLERTRARPDLPRVEVQVFGLLAPGAPGDREPGISARCEGTGVTIDGDTLRVAAPRAPFAALDALVGGG